MEETQCVCVCLRVCICVCPCRRVATAASPLLSLISNQLSRAEAQGHLWTRPFFSFSLCIIPFFLFILSSSPAILSRHVMLCLFSRRSLAPSRPRFPATRNPVHLSHCVFYQLIRSFCSSSAGLV